MFVALFLFFFAFFCVSVQFSGGISIWGTLHKNGETGREGKSCKSTNNNDSERKNEYQRWQDTKEDFPMASNSWEKK